MNQKEMKVIKVLADVTGRDFKLITRDQNLSVDLGIDSAKGLELLLELETQANLIISDDDAARIKTVGDLLNFVNRPA